MTNSCPQVTVGQTLTNNQLQKLGWISHLSKGRDVVLAIDMTESVGLNNEGRILLRQIVSESLQPGDVVYIVPFADVVNPLNPNINPITAETGSELPSAKAGASHLDGSCVLSRPKSCQSVLHSLHGQYR